MSEEIEVENGENEKVFLFDRIRFAWWNTSLSPIGKSRFTTEQREVARKVVKALIDDFGVDFLALGEVTLDDLTYLKDGCEKKTLGIYDGTLREGRLQFDTGAIYNLSRFNVFDSSSIVTQQGRNGFKTANCVTLTSDSSNTPFHIFISHWPSRMVAETSSTRKLQATQLRDRVNEIEGNSQNASIILMGDFNDEPFDESLANLLLATRDRGLAMNSPGFLYNPFWRHLGESTPYSFREVVRCRSGSCYHKAGQATRWRTFDQILFSSAFLGKSEWHLNEKATMILEYGELAELIVDSKSIFDHFPIISTIESEF